MTVERFTLPARPDAASVARRRARAAADRRLPQAAAETLYLLVNELVANAVEKGAVPGPLEVEMRFREHSVEVAVVDPGTACGPPPDAVTPPRGAGFGLHHVEDRAERWGVTCDGRTRVWFELSRAA